MQPLVLRVSSAQLKGLKKALSGSKWHPREHIVLAGSADSNVWMWNADTSTYLLMFSGHRDNVTCGDFTPDGNTVCTGSNDTSLRIWNLNGGNMHVIKGIFVQASQFYIGICNPEAVTCLALSSNSLLAITGSTDSSVHMVNITTGKV
ncbi:hypothetical protein GIB67_028494 [Kingdonia uniflora]|uniref:Uncharacterized protein n=1 Tax=Kingdonia uniflora TaxID=39325 RepID=A0A7J7P177_9MAGN|nr:hypothetical protein GIB67_028494 [Kingdonia uniflora]